MTPNDRAHAYVRKIRNNAKQQYAYAYLMMLLHPEKTFPTLDAKVFGVGVMAAQAVRLTLTDILTQTGEYAR